LPPEKDAVSLELRAAEREIDEAYRSNPLIAQPLATAGWYVLAFCEEQALRHFNQTLEGTSVHQEAAFADSLIVHAKTPLIWLHRSCRPGGRIPRQVDERLYGAAHELSELAKRYFSFETIFTNAGLGLATLALRDRTIEVSGPLTDDPVYEAYDRLIDPPRSEDTVPQGFVDYLSRLAQRVLVQGDRFSYDLDPRFVIEAREAMSPMVADRFSLPESWRFERFSIGDFVTIAKTLLLLSMFHFHARLVAATMGCEWLGMADSVLVTTPEALLRRLRRYTDVATESVAAVVDALTYGTGGLKSPDVALQPLIRLGDKLALSPNLITSSAMERNLAVLLNRIPEYRQQYAALSGEREEELRDELKTQVENPLLRFWHGTIGEWGGAGEIDLVIIDDEHHACLMLELKSFIGPAEPREMFDRSKEIAKGIDQVRKRREQFLAAPGAFFKATRTDERYRVSSAVASKTSIGGAYVQATDVGVIRSAHLAEKIRLVGLPAAADWLQGREYLPKNGVHFESVPFVVEVAGWSLQWYGVRPLINGRYV
jgi:hypothetical protein